MKLRTIFSWLAFSFLLLSAGKSQFYGGLSGGFNFSQIDGDGFGGYGKVGLNLGGYVHYDFDDRIGFQMELLYSCRGAREAIVETGEIYHWRLNYMDWVLLGNFTLVGNGKQALVAHAGFSPGYLLYAKSGRSGFTSNISGVLRNLDVCAIAGLTLYFTPHVSMVSRFNYSIADILASADPNTSARFSNHFISLLFRYEFR
jgi:Outer membrane protein beta-barrel domain